MRRWATRLRYRSGASSLTKRGGNRPHGPPGQQAANPAPAVMRIGAQVLTPSLTYTDESGSAVPAPVAGAGIVELPLVTAITQVNPTGVPVSASLGAPNWASGATPTTFAATTGTTAPNVDVGDAGIYMVPASIDPTGVTNITADFNTWLATVPDGATIRFQPGGLYRSDGTLIFRSRSNLGIDGNGAKIYTNVDGSGEPEQLAGWPRTRAGLWIEACTNVIVTNLEYQGPNATAGTTGPYIASLEAQHAVTFQGTNGGTVTNCNLHNVYGDLVYAGLTFIGGMRGSSNITIANNNLHGSGRQGVATQWCEDLLIENNTIADIRRSGIDLEPSSSSMWIDRVTIRGNTQTRRRLSWLACAGSSRVDNIVLENNHVAFVGAASENPNMDIACYSTDGTRRRNWIVRNNTVSPPGQQQGGGGGRGLFYFARVDGIEVYGHTLVLAGEGTNPPRTGVFVDTVACCNVNVHDNGISSGSQGAVYEWRNDQAGYVCP